MNRLLSAAHTRRRIRRYRFVARTSALVRPRAAFMMREAAHSSRPAAYRIRGTNDARVAFRHATFDTFTLDEVFGQEIYEPPRAVAQLLTALERPLRVLDLGANIGLFGLYVSARFPVARLTAFEPDPDNRRILEATVQLNDGTWDIHAAAAANRDGHAAFYADGTVNASLAETSGGRPIDVRTEDVIPIMGEHDLVKIDIEGGEWSILTDERFASISARAIALEYHPELCPGRNARRAAEACLARGGFRVEGVPTQAPPGYGSLWAWRA